MNDDDEGEKFCCVVGTTLIYFTMAVWKKRDDDGRR